MICVFRLNNVIQVGFLVDRYKYRPIVVQLLLLSSALTLFSYVWLAIPPAWIQTPIPAILSFAIGHGFSPCESVDLTAL
jgi:hypothetical protein